MSDEHRSEAAEYLKAGGKAPYSKRSTLRGDGKLLTEQIVSFWPGNDPEVRVVGLVRQPTYLCSSTQSQGPICASRDTRNTRLVTVSALPPALGDISC